MKRFIALILARPLIFLLGLVAVTGASLYLIQTGFRVEADIAEAIKGRSQAYAEFAAFEERFGAPSKDEVFMVQSADLGADGALTALEDLVIELSLTKGVLGVMSVFSLPDPDGEALSFLARSEMADLSEAERLDLTYAKSPFARQLLSEDRTTTLISVIPDRSIPPDERFAAMSAAVDVAGGGLKVTPIGLTAVQRTISQALISDLLFLVPATILICLILSLVLFRSWRAAVICTIPAVLGLIWTFGAMAALGIAFTAILAIAPAVLIVLGIADSIHVFNAIALHRQKSPLTRAVADGLSETFPAILLATVTTVLAFASLRVVGSPTLSDLALIGGLGLIVTLVAVVIAVPVATHMLLPESAEARALVPFTAISRIAHAVLDHRRLVAVATALILAALLVAQTQTVAGFNVTDHVPYRSPVRAALDELNRKLPGSDQLYVVVEDADRTPAVTEADRARLKAASAALYGDPDAMPDTMEGLPLDNASVRRFLGGDHTAFALPVASRLSDDASGTLARAEAVQAALAEVGLSEVSTITGYMVMASVEIPNLVWELRTAFYIAVALVTLLAAVLLRSISIALISVAPNLIPILGIEAWLLIWGRPMTITDAIGLTIAFGIAVDNAIHLLNRLRLERASLGHPTRAEISAAITAVVPPIATTTLILAAGLGTTVFSALPSAALFGQLVTGAMILAFLADLFLFPSLLALRDISEEKK